MDTLYIAIASPPNEEKEIIAVFETREEAEECINRFKTRFYYENGRVEPCKFFKEGEYYND